MSNFKVIHRVADIKLQKKEVKSTQKQPSCEKVVRPLKAWAKKVGKSKVAAKNGCNDINFDNNATAVTVKIY